MTPPDDLSDTADREPIDTMSLSSQMDTVHLDSSATEVGEIPIDFHGVAQGADDVPGRLFARHDAPVPPHGDDDLAVASHIPGLGPDVAWQ